MLKGTITLNEKRKYKPRMDRGSVKITARDIAALRFIIEQDEVSVPQLQILLARESTHTEKPTLSIGATYDQISRWRRAGWVEFRNPYRDPNKPGSVYATRKGITDFGYDFKYRLRELDSLDHIFAINDVRLWLENWAKDRGYADFKWISERELRLMPQAKYPDAEVTYSTSAGRWRIAIEVETSRKSKAAYQSIKSFYLQASYNDVWYFHEPALHSVLNEMLGDIARYRTLDGLELFGEMV